MLYTGIIAALSSLDLGIKWLIERENRKTFPNLCRIQRKNPALPEPQRRISLRLSGTAWRTCADAPAGGYFRSGRFSDRDSSSERQKSTEAGHCIILGVPSATFMTAWCGVMWWITSAFSVEN